MLFVIESMAQLIGVLVKVCFLINTRFHLCITRHYDLSHVVYQSCTTIFVVPLKPRGGGGRRDGRGTNFWIGWKFWQLLYVCSCSQQPPPTRSRSAWVSDLDVTCLRFHLLNLTQFPDTNTPYSLYQHTTFRALLRLQSSLLRPSFQLSFAPNFVQKRFVLCQNFALAIAIFASVLSKMGNLLTYRYCP